MKDEMIPVAMIVGCTAFWVVLCVSLYMVSINQ